MSLLTHCREGITLVILGAMPFKLIIHMARFNYFRAESEVVCPAVSML